MMKTKKENRQATKTAGTNKARSRSAKNAKAAKKKYVIIFHGKANSGKTTTLIALGRMLLPESIYYSEWNLDKLLKLKKNGKRISGRDREIKCTWKDRRIYIYTMGDMKDHVRKVAKGRAISQDTVSIIASRWDKKTLKIESFKKATVIDIPSVKQVGSNGATSFTTARELYLQLKHL